MSLVTTQEAIFLTVGALLILIYQVIYAINRRRHPLKTAFGRASLARRLWVEAIIKGNKDILAVQTLRNWTMAATFLASAAILIASGILHASVTQTLSHAMSTNLFGSKSPELWTIKFLLLAAPFIIAFFNFTLSIRYYNHVGYLINTPANSSLDLSAQDIAEVINTGARHYNLGMNAYYLSVPLLMWLFGPVWFLLGSVLLLWFRYTYDYAK